MKLFEKKYAPNHRFDFEIGYLVKSPCKECDVRPLFPECMKHCEVLERIHILLSDTVSSTGSR